MKPVANSLRMIVLSLALMLSATLPASAGPITGQIPDITQPNIVVILTDDQDYQSDILDSMPNLQQLLIDTGMTFSNFYAPVPLCCPARATMLRGQYSHNTQILQNTLPIGGFALFLQLGLENDTYATALSDAGYQTALIGKYLNEYPNADDLTHIPPGWDDWIVPITSAYGSYDYDMNENGVIVSYGNQPEDHISDVITGKALDFITRTTTLSPTAPFFLELNYYAPHSPAIAAPRHLNMFPGAGAPRGASFNESDMSDKPAFMQTMPLLTESQIASIDSFRRKQLQYMQSVDEGIAAVIQSLTDAGQLDNTYILFFSDNGLKMGAHRFGVSKGAPYDEDIRMPFIVRGPGVPAGVTRPDLISMVDIAPTLTELGGTAMTYDVDGRSIVPLLHSTVPPTVWRNTIFLEHWSPPAAGRTKPHPAGEPDDPGDAQIRQLAAQNPDLNSSLVLPDWKGLRTQQYKFVDRIGPGVELYDMEHDRYEIYSQYPDASPVFRSQLDSLLADMFVCAGAACRQLEELPPPVWSLLYNRADINRDGQVSALDVTHVAGCWLQTVVGECGDRNDLDYDGDIDVSDIQRVAASFNAS